MTNVPHKTYFNWSSGKDAALALYHLQRDPNYSIQGLVTTLNSHHERVTMHGLRKRLLQQQVEVLQLIDSTGQKSNTDLYTVELPEHANMEIYEKVLGEQMMALKAAGYSHSAFGDIFLEELRQYREQQLSAFGIKPVFPLWGRDTKTLLQEFIQLGFKAIVVCIQSELLDQSFVGREIDAAFIEDLPANVDPCGENGEFHTFCYDGPIFTQPVGFTKGEKIFRTYPAPKDEQGQSQKEDYGFWFIDLIPE
ncbi:MAG: ATP-binding protein [Bacteroidota bacterium]